MKNLCSCNNCGNTLTDENPQTGAKEYPDFIPSKQMVRETDEDGEHWACPVCKTDAYFSDHIPTFFVSIEYGNTGYVDSLGEFIGQKTKENVVAQILHMPHLLPSLEDCGEIKFFLWGTKGEMEEAAEDGHDCYDCDFRDTWEELTNPPVLPVYGEGKNIYKIRQTFTIVQEITVMADDAREALDIAETVECYTELMDEDFPECEIISESIPQLVNNIKNLGEGLSAFDRFMENADMPQ